MRQILRHVIHSAGYEFVRTNGRRTLRRRYGIDLLRDARRLLNEPAAHVFDVGANRGQSAREYLSAFPAADIYCFEPSPQTYARLARWASGRPRVHCLQVAVGAQPGRATLHCNRMAATDSLLPASDQARQHLADPAILDVLATVEVPVVTIDAFCWKRDLRRIDLLKIDTQGYEMHVLAGARRMLAATHLICLEVCFVELYTQQARLEEVYALLSGQGYRLVGLYNEARMSGPSLSFADALFWRA